MLYIRGATEGIVRTRLPHMNVILALCLLALAPLTPWNRSVNARAAPMHHVATSESWEFEESTESQEDGLNQGSLSRKHNLAELLLPYIQRELTESRPLISKKNAKTAHVNSRKKHVVEITPLRGKGRDGKPLAYILAPAKADLRRALAKRIDKHHITHENKNYDSYRAHTKSLIEPSSEEDSSEEVTIKAGKLIPFGESKELGSSADISKETILIDKTTSHRESKQPSSSEVASEQENVVSGKSTSIEEETESDSSGDSSKDGSTNSDTSTLLEEPEKSLNNLNKGFSEEEKSDKSVSLAESENSVSKDNADEASVKSDKSVSIEEPNESLSSKYDSENIVKLDRTLSFTETEESGSSNDVKEEEPVNLDKIISFEESKQSSSSANDTKEDTAPIVDTKEYRSNEGNSKEETGKFDNATLLDQRSGSRSGEDVTEVKTITLDSVENSTSVEESIISKFSTDQTDNTVHESFKDGSSKTEDQKNLDEINDTILVENVNELKDKPDEANSESKNEKETNASEINEDQAAKKFEGEKINIKIEDETQIDKHSEEISQNEDVEQPKSEIPIVINENEVSESEKSVENTEEEGKFEILTPGNELVEKITETTTIEVANEQSKTGQQAEGDKLEESTEQANTIELVRDSDNLIEKGNFDEINKAEPVVEESKCESLIEESKPSAPVADREIKSVTGNTEEESMKENSLEESKIEAVEENNIDKVADTDTNLEGRIGNTENQSSVSAKLGKNKIVKIKKLFDKSSVEDSETIFTHSRLRTVSSKLPNDGIIITQQDGLNNIWKPESQNVIELIQSPPCQPRGEGPSDRTPLEHKSYRLSFLFNK